MPARVEYVGLLRMLISSLAADRRELDEERLDDLRLAVSEACNLILDTGSGTDRRLSVIWREDVDAVVLELHDGRETDLAGLAPHPWAMPPDPERLDEDETLPLQLIGALVDDVSLASDDGVDKLRLAVRCPPAPHFRTS